MNATPPPQVQQGVRGNGPDTKVLYLVTDEMSSALLKGQLGYLQANGFNVTAAARLADPTTPKAGAWDEGVAVSNLPFEREPAPRSDLRALRATVRLIRRVRPDITIAMTPKAGLLGMLAAWSCRVPTRIYVVWGFRFETTTGKRRRFFKGLEWLAMHTANKVVFVSPSLRDVAVEQGLLPQQRSKIVGNGSGNGINVARFDPSTMPSKVESRTSLGLPADVPVVGFVGRFTRDKGIADLVNAFATVREQYPTAQLLLVGQFEDGDPVDPTTRSTIDAAPWVTVVPWLDYPEMAYRAMDVLAFPSYREGLPNVPLEAQLCGVPVVAYQATGTVDAIAPSNSIVVVGDVDDLAAQIVHLLGDPPAPELAATWVCDQFDQRPLWRQWADWLSSLD